MKRLAPILALLLLLVACVPAQAQITVDYPSNLRDLQLEVDEEYIFTVWIQNISEERLQVIVETEIEDLEIRTLEPSLIIEPSQRIALPITLSVEKEGEFSKVLRISFIQVWENATRKGTTCRIKLEGYAKRVYKPFPWWILVIIIIVTTILGMIKNLKDRGLIFKRRKR